ncbi:uncharacterized protein LOC129764931 [Toxorhynchites rutilus septentrionalis]|uniref:uncharacterized protein LOC129764931 n=1 Tax=Toxorhynchites rutilus septentrionalis TaxID=329112 RepID=UPI00247AD07D|nr:uncharacterized protein LOC129764931 [Toxorhynchites rutilus septentrionalis]
MNVDPLPERFAPSNIDLKRKEVSHISAWRDKEEFQHVYELIFAQKSDTTAKESALQTLKMWKIRQSRHTPVSVLCTIAILEGQNYDARCKQDGRDNVVEVKSVYSGAFTRFINHLTEYHQQTGAGRRGTMATKVKEIGIEGFLVELRHLCAHSSVSISIDVFRRSAEYCMNWLETCYWKRELQQIQNCDVRHIKQAVLGDKFQDDLDYIVRIYDIATKAIHKGASSLSGAEQHLTPPQFKLLQEHAKANRVDQLNSIVFDIVRFIAESMQLPRCFETTLGVCGALLNCHYMLEAPAKGSTQGLPHIHQRLFQMLVVKGYMQTYLEKLIAICEDDQERHERRLGAKFWAIAITRAYRLLKRFKKALKDMPEKLHQFNRKEHTRKMSKTVKAIYQNKLRLDLKNTIVIGMSVNCPWHLKLSRNYLVERILNVNGYTKEILPNLLALADPSLNLNQRELIEGAVETFTMNFLSVVEDEEMLQEDPAVSGRTSTPKRGANARKQESYKVFTLEDALNASAGEKENAGTKSANSEKVKQFGIWSEVQRDEADWATCPLGKILWD